MSSLLISHILRGIFRDRFILILLALFAVCAGLSVFFGVSAVTEQDQFALIFLASFVRLVGVFVLILFITSFVRRSFDHHSVEFLLTKPVSRFQFIFSHNLAFYILALLILVASSLVLCPFVVLKTIHLSGFVVWSVGLLLEYLLICAIALFFATLLKTPVAAILSSTGFYILARIVGDLIGIVEAQKNEGGLTQIFENIITFISIFIPRLDLLVQSSWLLYGGGELTIHTFPAIQIIVFCALVFMATLLDFNRKEF